MKVLNTILIGLMIAACSACVTIYSPTPINTPLLKRQGELKTSVLYQKGLNLHGSYAVLDNVGIAADWGYNFSENESTSEENTNSEVHKSIGGAIGVFNSMSDHWMYEIFTGYGYEKFRIKNRLNIVSSLDKDIKGKINKYYIQPSIGFYDEDVEFSFSLRMIYIMLDDIKSTDPNLKLDRERLFFEPAFTFKAGPEQVKFFSQIGWSNPEISGVFTNLFNVYIFGAVGLEVNITSLISGAALF